MKLVNPKFEILEQGSGLEGIYKQIELAGRTCYKSEDKITEDSAKKFVDMLINRGHTAVLEQGTVYLHIEDSIGDDMLYESIEYKYGQNPYSKLNIKIIDKAYHFFITTNYRVLYENNWFKDLKYLCEPTEHHAKRISVRFYTDIGITRELNRHRKNSVCEQSTRYCNYSKDRFSKSITVTLNDDINPKEFNESINKWSRGDIKSPRNAFRIMCGEVYNFKEDEFSIVDLWIFGNAASEFTYMELINRGWTPQQARRVLPLDLHSEIVHTAFVDDWEHFFSCRTSFLASTGKPHPDMSALADPLYKEFEKRGYLN